MPHDSTPAPTDPQSAPSPEEIILAEVEAGVFSIDDLGRVWRSMIRRGPFLFSCRSRRAENRSSLGYLQVRLMVNAHRFHVGAHRIVWWHLYGPIPPGYVINHLNGVKSDNRPWNLECTTYSGNTTHAHRSGLIDQRGERNPASKLTDRQVAEIRLIYSAGGITQQELASRYGVRFQHISRVVKGERRLSQLGPIQIGDLRHVASDRDPVTGRFVRDSPPPSPDPTEARS